MMAWMNNLLATDTRAALAKRGIDEIKPDKWYKFQIFLDAMRDIVDSSDNVTSKLVAIGKGVGTSLTLEDFPSVEAFRQFVESIHSANVRNLKKPEGLVVYEEGGELFLMNNTPTSNDIVYGFAWELLSKTRIEGQYYVLVPHRDYPSNEVGSVFKMEPQDD